MKLSRREVLGLGAGAAALWATGAGASAAVLPKRRRKVVVAASKPSIGLQLYSVRKDCEKDLPAVLEAVGKMGYAGVEFAGYYGRKADELRKLLDKNGLKCCGTHTALATLNDDAWKETVEFNKTIGNKYLIVPSLPKKNVESKDAVIATAKLFTDLAAKGKEVGMFVGYHAHPGDFTNKFGGETEWDILFGNTGPAVLMQMDIGNCLGGGGNPYGEFKKFPGRSPTVHIKDHGGKRGAVIGEGTVKWDEVFQLCETIGKTEWYIVEQEAYDGTPLDSVKRCFEALKKMGKA